MKTKFIFPVIVTGLALCSHGQEAVVIEGGPNQVRISSRDSQDQGATTNQQATTTTQPVQPIVPPPVTPAIGIDTTVTSTVRPRAPRLEGTVVTEVETAPVADTEIIIAADGEVEQDDETNAAKARIRAGIAREFNIVEGAANALLRVRTDNMFEENNPSQLTSAGIPVLTKISQYLSVTPYDEVELRYYRNPEETGQLIAWNRSISVVDWLTRFDPKGKNEYTVKTPRVSAATEKMTKPVEKGGEEIGDYIEFDIRQ